MKKLEPLKVYITLSLVALGLIIGSLVSFLKLPIYLDTIGIMLATLLLGWRYGVFSAILTALISFFIVSPYVPFYFPVMLIVVFLTEYLFTRGMYSNFGKTIVSGIIQGIAGALGSTPITYYLFDGFTASGNDIIVSYFHSLGIDLMLSILVSLLIFAIIDRTITCIFCRSVFITIPPSFLKKNDIRQLNAK